MKKLFITLFILFFVLSCQKKSEVIISEDQNIIEYESPLSVEEDEKPLYTITEGDVLKIWVRSDFAPGMYLDDNGELQGFYVDLEKEIMKEMGQKYEFVPYNDILLAIDKIKTGEAHSALGTPDLTAYKSMANISDIFIVFDYYKFVHDSSEERIFNNTDEVITSLFGKKVGVQAKGHIYQQLIGYGQIELMEYPTTTFALEALNRKEVDTVFEVIVAGDYYAKQNNWKIKHVGDVVFSIGMGTGFSKTLELSVVERYNIALEGLIKSGFVKKLYKSYYN